VFRIRYTFLIAVGIIAIVLGMIVLDVVDSTMAHIASYFLTLLGILLLSQGCKAREEEIDEHKRLEEVFKIEGLLKRVDDRLEEILIKLNRNDR